MTATPKGLRDGPHFLARRFSQNFLAGPVRTCKHTSRGNWALAASTWSSTRHAANCGGKECGAGLNLLRCGSCKEVYYCDPECQRAAWPGHKEECRRSSKVQRSAGRERQVTTADRPDEPRSLSALIFGSSGEALERRPAS
jgi:hypothetical protein